jgi:alkanesulfonate monooxygenase SsuD/methylene tetrahydromethanopterin reductase-like flavin-dependent oxidoreductase (luciferase family)
MRRLWTERSVTFKGKFDTVTGAGLAPLPVQRPIPVWIGSAATKGYERIGRLADGWFPMMSPGPKLDDARRVVNDAAIAAGRDPEAIGMEGRINTADPDAAATALAEWADAGASHVTINTMGRGLKTVDDHLAALTAIAKVVSA